MAATLAIKATASIFVSHHVPCRVNEPLHGSNYAKHRRSQSMHTHWVPCMPIARAAPRDRSSVTPCVNGPRSLITTVTEFPFWRVLSPLRAIRKAACDARRCMPTGIEGLATRQFAALRNRRSRLHAAPNRFLGSKVRVQEPSEAPTMSLRGRRHHRHARANPKMQKYERALTPPPAPLQTIRRQWTCLRAPRLQHPRRAARRANWRRSVHLGKRTLRPRIASQNSDLHG